MYKKNALDIKHVLQYPLQFLLKKFVGFHVKWPLKFSDINKNLERLTNATISNFMKIHFVVLEISHAFRWTDRHTVRPPTGKPCKSLVR
jgi:hypothetical protein